MSILTAAEAYSSSPPSLDPLASVHATARIDEVLAGPWHFSETFRALFVQDLAPVVACYASDQAPVTAAFAPRVVQLLLESGWTLDLAGMPDVIRVLRPAHLPPAVRFVDGAWVSMLAGDNESDL